MKKPVTAGEVDTWGKEHGKCTHQWTRNDEKSKQALSTLSVFVRLKKKDNNKKKKEAEKRTDEKEAIKLDQTSCLSSSLLLSSFCCCLSFVFYLTKTLSVESACLFFSSFVGHWWVHFPRSFPHVSASPTVNRFFFKKIKIKIKTKKKKNNKQKTAYEICRSLVGSEMCIRDSPSSFPHLSTSPAVTRFFFLVSHGDISYKIIDLFLKFVGLYFCRK